jgi:hypothetical protein
MSSDGTPTKVVASRKTYSVGSCFFSFDCLQKPARFSEDYDLTRTQPWLPRPGFGAQERDTVYGGHSEWRRLVRDYTRRHLTFESDRLRAISGIARRFDSTFKTQYLAGLWEGSLGADLCWETSSRARGRQPTTYIAPSWSWASTNEPVTMNKWVEQYGVRSFNIQLLEAKLDTAGPDQYGAITGGYLLLSAKLLPRSSTAKVGDRKRLLTCITRQHNDDETWNMYLGISIEFVGEENTFRRVGVIQDWDGDDGKSPLEDVEETVFKLI